MYPNQSCRYSTNFRLARLIRCALFLLCLFGSLSHAAPAEIMHFDNHQCKVQLGQIRATRDAPDQTIRHWSQVSLPDNWEKRWKGYSGTVWYQINWTQHCDTTQSLPIALAIHSISMAGEVYLNEKQIWKDQSLVEPLSRSWNSPRYWVFPPESFKSGHNQIDIKVVGVATQTPGLGEVYLGQSEFVLDKHQHRVLFNRTLYFINLIASLTLGTITFVIWLLRSKESTFGWFALTSFLWSIFIGYTLSSSGYPFSTAILTAKFNMLLLMLYSLCFIIFSWRFANRKFKKTERVLWGIFITLTLLLYFLPDQRLQLILFINFLFTVALFLSNCIGFQWIAFKTKQPEVRFLALTFVIYIAICIHDVSRILLQDSSAIYLTPFSAPLMALAVSLILAWRIARNMNNIENFNQQLEQNIEQTKLELKQSLNNEHQLEIENIRLQERINLSHDLHDGLGGSLVRSMFLVDKAEDFDKQHFMSILKLLRNDLRQIIDSGSMIGIAIPESPVVWAAPLRRRFVEIFDEIDIESHWDLPQYWPIQPTALEFLTMARVTEETLTNVLKHSRAKFVKISLSHYHEHEMRLYIEDDGIGFDPSMVQTGLHVGLHSMQIRVQRIGGILNIRSRSGQTIIEVILCRAKP